MDSPIYRKLLADVHEGIIPALVSDGGYVACWNQDSPNIVDIRRVEKGSTSTVGTLTVGNPRIGYTGQMDGKLRDVFSRYPAIRC
jgi:hypothetical protein